jgi:hypothetical protein
LRRVVTAGAQKIAGVPTHNFRKTRLPAWAISNAPDVSVRAATLSMVAGIIGAAIFYAAVVLAAGSIMPGGRSCPPTCRRSQRSTC